MPNWCRIRGIDLYGWVDIPVAQPFNNPALVEADKRP